MLHTLSIRVRNHCVVPPSWNLIPWLVRLILLTSSRPVPHPRFLHTLYVKRSVHRSRLQAEGIGEEPILQPCQSVGIHA